MATTSLSFVENKESRVSSMNQEVIDTTSISVRAYKVGNIYRYANHTFAIWAKGAWKNETTGKVSNHVVFAVTFDGGSQEQYLDSEGIKQKIGDERRAVRAVSMDSNGKATKVKRTGEENAMLIEQKYDKVISAIEDLTKKLGCSDEVIICQIQLFNALHKEKYAKAEAMRNEAKQAYLANVARRDEIKHAIEINEARLAEVYAAKDYVMVAEYGKQIQGFQAELILLEQKIADYETAQSASKANEETEETTAENVSEQPAE